MTATDHGTFNLIFGGIPPAWNETTFALANFRRGKLICCDAEKVAERIEKGFPRSRQDRRGRWHSLAQVFDADGAVRWQSDLGEPNKFEVAFAGRLSRVGRGGGAVSEPYPGAAAMVPGRAS